jgi:hypothetical protein
LPASTSKEFKEVDQQVESHTVTSTLISLVHPHMVNPQVNPVPGFRIPCRLAWNEMERRTTLSSV